MRISFIGDIALNDAYTRLGKDPFASIERVLSDSDFVVGNLECTCESAEGENELKKPRLKTTLSALSYLKSLSLDVALLANNHMHDNLDDGFKKTIDFLDANGIQRTGAGFTSQEAKKTIVLSKDGVTVCLLNYVHKNTNPKPFEGTKIEMNFFDIDRIVQDVKLAKKQYDHVIVCPHWGGDFECGSYPNINQSKIAETIIAAGASAIIGHHSHTLQPYELIGNVPVFHSLGNFCFANIEKFGHEVNNKLGKESVIVKVELDKESLRFNLVPLLNKKHNIEEDCSGIVMSRLNRRNKQYQKMRVDDKKFKFYAKKHKYFDTFYFFFFGNNRFFFDRLKHINLSRLKYYFLRK